MKNIYSENAPAAIGPYSHAVAVRGTVYCSGQIGLDPATGALAGEDIAAQAAQACRNVGEVLAAAGCGFDRVVKTTVFLTDMDDFAAFNAVYEQYFISRPARSCVAVRQLPKNALCEIEAVAVRPHRKKKVQK